MSSFSPESELPLAVVALRVRKLRSKAFDPGLFADPAWDILLILRVKGAMSAAQLAERLGFSVSLVERWLGLLGEQQIIQAREGQFALSDEASDKLDKIFAGAVSVPVERG